MLRNGYASSSVRLYEWLCSSTLQFSEVWTCLCFMSNVLQALNSPTGEVPLTCTQCKAWGQRAPPRSLVAPLDSCGPYKPPAEGFHLSATARPSAKDCSCLVLSAKPNSLDVPSDLGRPCVLKLVRLSFCPASLQCQMVTPVMGVKTWWVEGFIRKSLHACCSVGFTFSCLFLFSVADSYCHILV